MLTELPSCQKDMSNTPPATKKTPIFHSFPMDSRYW